MIRRGDVGGRILEFLRQGFQRDRRKILRDVNEYLVDVRVLQRWLLQRMEALILPGKQREQRDQRGIEYARIIGFLRKALLTHLVAMLYDALRIVGEIERSPGPPAPERGNPQKSS